MVIKNTAMELKPIETIYNGYRFRSRLEARWAVFFDACGIKYQYEPEGFNIGFRYLPDFYLPWWNCFVEIKPDEKEAISEGELCCTRLFNEKADIVTMLCVGDPLNDDIRICCITENKFGSGGPYFLKARFLEGCEWSAGECGNWSYSKHHISIVADTISYLFTSNYKMALVDTSYELAKFRNDFDYAKEQARKARFEYGETPKITRR